MGVFANALTVAVERGRSFERGGVSAGSMDTRPGLGAWLLSRLRRSSVKEPRLALVERITIAPRQTVALVEADGQRFLVATSAEGAPVFVSLKPAASRSAKKRPCGASVEGNQA